MRSSIFLVECRFKSGTAYLETDPSEATFTNRDALVAAIVEGQIEDVVSIHLVNFDAFIVYDVTEEIMCAVETAKEAAA